MREGPKKKEGKRVERSRMRIQTEAGKESH